MGTSDVRELSPMRRGTRRGFWALIATQFQGAFNDNAFKYIIILFLLRFYLGTNVEDEAVANRITGIATMLFAVPFVLFPVYAGVLADRFSKRSMAIAMKYAELIIMCLGLVAFLVKSPAFIWITLFLMLTQSTFFSPAKYGMMPEILSPQRLSWGNGVLNMTTFMAIILGTAVAGPLRDWLGDRVYLASAPLIALSVAGIITAHGIPKPPAANPHQRMPLTPWWGMGRYFKMFRADRWLFLTMLGIAFFFFAGAMIQNNIVRYGAIELGIQNDTQISLLAAALALGIGVGSLGAGYLSGSKIEVGLIPLGALGIAAFSALLAIPGFHYTAGLGLLFGLGFFGGFYIVPLNAVLQERSPDDAKGGMIATSNFVTFAGVLVAGAAYWLFGTLGLNSYHVFLIIALMTLATGIYICSLLPVFLLRFILWCLAHTVYRIKVLGRENVPEKGGALLVANHTSFVDALAMIASTDRLVRFVMFQGYYDAAWIRPLAKILKAIPVSSTGGPKELLESLRTATQAIKDGDVVCIFAEGQITRTGQLLPFNKGFERVMRNVDAPIIPVHLDRLWGSIFSFAGKKFLWKWPKRVPYPITVSYGAHMPSDSTAPQVRNAIMELGTEAYMQREIKPDLLNRAFIRMARRHPGRLAVADGRTGGLSYFKTLVASIIFARKLRPLLGDHPMTGVLLPPTVGGALTNIALQTMGKVPINLNYTLPAAGLASCAEQCGISHVITAKALLEKLPVEVPGEAIYLEDVKDSVKKGDRIVALLLAVFCPVRLLERLLGAPAKRSGDDLASIIFSSGSEGVPKGIMLTQRNVLCNIESALQVFPHETSDGLMGILPLFHSFGFTATLWLTLTEGMFSVFHPTPLEPKAIGGLIYKYKPKLFVATSTLLQGFIRRCTPEELSSLEFVVCGAEKLTDRVREAFTAKFGVEPLEGYGATECAPVVSVSVPDWRAPGFYQKGHKRGSIGRPLPGVSVRVKNPDTGEIMPEGEPGMLYVKGPNVMKGYLDMPEKTAAVLQDGWYETGDIASVDDDGFIFISGRLARFSKIGGEMIPHTRVEDTLHELIGLTDLSLAVTSVPDQTKGERLLVLHTLEEEQLEELLGRLASCDMPNLWIPRANAFYRVSEIPVLGTGKMDIRAVKNMAETLYVGEGEA